MLELWKSEQQTETELHPEVIRANTDAMIAKAAHDRKVQVMEMSHRHLLEHEKQRVELGIFLHEEE